MSRQPREIEGSIVHGADVIQCSERQGLPVFLNKIEEATPCLISAHEMVKDSAMPQSVRCNSPIELGKVFVTLGIDTPGLLVEFTLGDLIPEKPVTSLLGHIDGIAQW